MATKLSSVTAKSGTNTADLVYLASTADGGSSYSSKSITIGNLFSSVASGTDLGTFSGSTLSANASVKTALQELETAHEAEVVSRGTAISAAVSALVDAAPGTLDTLNEIAAAINDDADVFTTLTAAIAAVQTDVDTNEADSDSGIASNLAALNALTAVVAALDAKTADGGDNVNTLVANTTPDSTPSTFYFLAVDASTGAIKVVNKNYIEVE